MALESSNYLRNDFTNNVKDALADSRVKDAISSAFRSYTGQNASSLISSFGIGVGLAFLGQFLATKERRSPTARFIARILGTDVDAINRDYILEKLKDKDFSYTVRKNILDVIQTSSIDEFAKSVNLSPGETWAVYRQIKDLIVDSEIIGMISRIHSETSRIETAISVDVLHLRTSIDAQLEQMSKLQDELYQMNGLSWLPRNYFEGHISTAEDTKNWKNGFAFLLPSIMQGKAFRRSALINEIKGRLLSQHQLLLAGESGASKTTILMEILTDYFSEGHEILYNFDGAEIKNGPQLLRFIERRLNLGDKILVVVDNAHTERTSAIFYAMEEIRTTFRDIRNIMFLLAATLPQYNSFDRLVKEGKDAIMKFKSNPDYRYDLLFFTKDEINGFIKKYIGKEFNLSVTDANGHSKYITADDETILSNFSEKVLEKTRGHPIMVKFLLLGDGLHTDVAHRYNAHLSVDSQKLQTMIIYSLLDLSNLPITDTFLENIGVLNYAYDLEHATLYQSEGFWKTIHPRWDIELISYLYNESDKRQRYHNKKYLKAALESIFNIKGENTSATQERAYFVIRTIYDIASQRVMPIDIIESELPTLPSYLTNEKKAELYSYYITNAYIKLGRYNDALKYYDKAINISEDEKGVIYAPELAKFFTSLDKEYRQNMLALASTSKSVGSFLGVFLRDKLESFDKDLKEEIEIAARKNVYFAQFLGLKAIQEEIDKPRFDEMREDERRKLLEEAIQEAKERQKNVQ